MANDSDNKKKVPEHKAVDLLSNLIEIPSIKGKSNDAIIHFILTELEELDCSPEVFIADSDKFIDYPEYCPDIVLSEGTEKEQKYVSGIIKGTGGGRSILIFSHLDTPDVLNADLWDTDPFKLSKKGDKLYGLGAADAKSGVAACLIALRVIKAMGIKLRGDVKFIGQNEKDMGPTGPLPIFTKACKVADGALYVHATEHLGGLGEVWFATDGVLTLRITVFGAKPQLREKGNPENYFCIKDGVNAIDKAVKTIEALSEYAKERDQKFNKEVERTTFNIGVIKGGEAPGVVADKCIVEGNIIFSTAETAHSIFGEIENVLQKVIETDADELFKRYPPRLEMIGLRTNPASINENEDIVQTLKECIEAEGGCNFQTYDHHQGSVIRFPIIYNQLPTIAFGPKGGNSHKHNHWVSRGEYIKTINILVNAIIKWCK